MLDTQRLGGYHIGDVLIAMCKPQDYSHPYAGQTAAASCSRSNPRYFEWLVVRYNASLTLSYAYFAMYVMSQLKNMCQWVPTGGWGSLLDPSLRSNTYLIFNDYLGFKCLSGWFVGETPADPPLGCGEWDHVSASHTKYFIFILFTLAATSHYQNGGGGGQKQRACIQFICTATMHFEAPRQI